MSKIQVVSAFVVRDGRILLAQRRKDDRLGFLWETPGGKVEGDESFHQALARELKEEFGFRVDAEVALGTHEVKIDDNTYLLTFYLVEYFSEDPVPREGQGFGWFTSHEATRLNMTPGTLWAFRNHDIRRILDGLCP